ncbi:MAG TPA: sulfotransferase domain-containing protein [Thalassobaculum sp.]
MHTVDTRATPGPVAEWPRKTREMHSHHFDSTVWNDFRFRPDDVVIASYAKSGTTWTQQIVGQLIFGGEPGVDVASISPWVDLRVPPREVKLPALEAQSHRRFLKTHLPVDALVFSPVAKYLYVARDGRDVVWSMYNHHVSANAEWYRLLNETPGLVGPPIGPPADSVHRYFHEWLDRDGHPFWPHWENVASWWAVRRLPNVLLLHYADLKADLPGEVRRIADFLGIGLDDATFQAVLRHCSFEHMKANAALVAPLGGAVFTGGGGSFINRGTNGRWRDTLTEQDCRRYEEIAEQRLGAACARWLAAGGPVDG